MTAFTARLRASFPLLRRAALGMVLAAAGCHLLTIGDRELVDDAACTPPASCPTPCTSVADCPGQDSVCASRSCVDLLCGSQFADAATSCADSGGTVCDGMGSCVECLQADQCGASDYCAVDHHCAVKKPAGSACDASVECAGMVCVDGVCCNGACAGPCESCVASVTGMADGSCAPVLTSTDPDRECSSLQRCDGCGACQGGVPMGGRLFGDAAQDYLFQAQLDSQNNTLLAGSFEGNIDFPGGQPITSIGGQDAYLVKLDVAGNHVWTRRYGAIGDQVAYSVDCDSEDNVYLTGAILEQPVDLGAGTVDPISWDAFVLKLDKDGNHQWAYTYGASSTQIAQQLHVDQDGNVIVAGVFLLGLDMGGGDLGAPGGLSTFVAKLDSSGNHVWSKAFLGINHTVTALSSDSAGDVYIAGAFQASTNFGTGNITASGEDGFVVKLAAADGSYLQSLIVGGPGSQQVRAIAINSAGHIQLAGHFNGNTAIANGPQLFSAGDYDVFLAQLDSTFSHRWSKSFGDAAPQLVYDLALGSADEVVLAGEQAGSVDFGGCPQISRGEGNAYVVKFDADGNHLFSWTAGDALRQGADSVMIASDDRIIVAGFASGSIDLGTGPLLTAGERDVFWAALTP